MSAKPRPTNPRSNGESTPIEMKDDERVNILIVDDQPSRLLSYEAILGDLKQNIVRASSGTEALHELMRREFAVILLDVNMPGMDGFETAQLIHQHPRYEKTPLVFVTAFNVTDMDRLKGYELGAVDYVFIPVIPAILRSKVAVLIELFTQKRELVRLNQSLAESNAELERANALLQVERERDLERLNHDLERANTELARTNQVLTEEGAVRRRAEEAQQRSDGHLRTILQNTSALIYQIDSERRFVHVNRQWEQLLRCSTDEVRGKSIFELFPESAAIDFDRNICQVLSECRPLEFEWTIGLPDGSQVVYSSIKAPLVDANGVPYGVVGVSTDITERKHLENTLKEADRRKDEFIALLAHELRNPLAPIVNGLELMKFKALGDPDLVWCRDVIGRQVAHLSRLVEDLLDVSRITQGKIKLQKRELAIAEVVTGAIETVRPLIETHRHHLSVELPEEQVQVEGDATRLAQVLGNLLSNAAKYTQDGGNIRLQVQRDDAVVVIRVQDDGVGIAPEAVPHLFELFTQFERTIDRSQGGLGIGLALVQRLVELHGGTVQAQSDGPGSGSEFTVRLPCSNSPSAALACADAPARGASTESLGLKVLVVDDNVDAAASLALVLRHLNYTVRTVHSGAEAVRAANEFAPQVVLLDLGMPGMNGYEVAERIRREPRGGDVLIIALTGWSQSHVREATVRAGFNLHLVKPVDIDELHRYLSALPNDPTLQPAR
jgi:PAS domain S-box-containing protein